MEKPNATGWYSAMIAATLLIIRAGLRLASGPPELGQGPTTERMNIVFLVILVGVLIYGLVNLETITKGREGSRVFTAITLGLGLLSAVILLFIGD